MNPRVRVTAVLVEDDRLLLVEQEITESLGRKWSLPGGTLEAGETLEECAIREVKEETGLDIELGRLLYVCDRIADNRHIVHITFAVERVGGALRQGAEPEPGANPIHSVKMIPLALLPQYGFDERFCELAALGFPESGTYRGAVSNIGL